MDNIPELSYLTKMEEQLLQLFNKKEDHAYDRVSFGGTEKGNRFIVTELEEFKRIETIPNSFSRNLSSVRNPRSFPLCIFSTPTKFQSSCLGKETITAKASMLFKSQGVTYGLHIPNPFFDRL